MKESEKALRALLPFSPCVLVLNRLASCLRPPRSNQVEFLRRKKKHNSLLIMSYRTHFVSLFLFLSLPLSSSILPNRYDGLGYQCSTEAWAPVRCLLMFDSSNLLRPALMIHSKSRWINMARRFTLHATQEAIKHTPLRIKCTPSSFDKKLRFTFSIFIAHNPHKTPLPHPRPCICRKSIVLFFSSP